MCNGLSANVGLEQIRESGIWDEAILICGTDIEVVARLDHLYSPNYGAPTSWITH
ncbi:MAG: hypothetical protein ACI87A_002861 [Planctomycetota bacterium]|jgi:hypothetical protein